jgi:hypothetical protein
VRRCYKELRIINIIVLSAGACPRRVVIAEFTLNGTAFDKLSLTTHIFRDIALQKILIFHLFKMPYPL